MVQKRLYCTFPRIKPVSVKRPPLGHARPVRKLPASHGKADTLITGRVGGVTFSDEWQDFFGVEWQVTGSLFGLETSTRSSHSGYPKQACTISID